MIPGWFSHLSRLELILAFTGNLLASDKEATDEEATDEEETDEEATDEEATDEEAMDEEALYLAVPGFT